MAKYSHGAISTSSIKLIQHRLPAWFCLCPPFLEDYFQMRHSVKVSHSLTECTERKLNQKQLKNKMTSFDMSLSAGPVGCRKLGLLMRVLSPAQLWKA